MSRLFEDYRVRRRDNLAAPDFWNRRFDSIDLRLALREQDAEKIDSAVDALTALALQRLNDTFTPLIVDAQNRLNQLAASFSAESFTAQTVALGSKAFELTEETAVNYVYTDYVTLRSADSPANTMTARVDSFDRESATLNVTVEAISGAGTYGHWLIRIGTPPEAGGHAARTDNPHSTTAAQVGAYTISAVDALILDLQEQLAELGGGVGDMLKSENLAGLTNLATARSNLGLLGMALKNPPAEATITDQASPIWSLAPSCPFQAAILTLGGNRTMLAPTGMQLCWWTLKIKQDATGGRTLTWPAQFKWPGGVAPVLSTAANALDVISGYCDGSFFYGTYMNALA